MYWKKVCIKVKVCGSCCKQTHQCWPRKEQGQQVPRAIYHLSLSFQWLLLLINEVYLIRKNLPYLEAEMIIRSEKDLNEGDEAFMSLLYNLQASNTMIGRIMEHIKGPGFGSFVPKTIYNMNQKSAKSWKLLKGCVITCLMPKRHSHCSKCKSDYKFNLFYL